MQEKKFVRHSNSLHIVINESTLWNNILNLMKDINYMHKWTYTICSTLEKISTDQGLPILKIMMVLVHGYIGAKAQGL